MRVQEDALAKKKTKKATRTKKKATRTKKKAAAKKKATRTKKKAAKKKATRKSEADIRIRPGVSPMDRGALEDMLLDRLGGRVDVLGGGTAFTKEGLQESDFQLELDARAAAKLVATTRELFDEVGFSLRTTITVVLDRKKTTFQVGGKPAK
jgi:membrane protein involved in colicin uptake